MKSIIAFVIGVMLAMSVGCAQLGVPSPDTFNKRLAVGYTTVTTVVETTTTLLQAQKISADDAENIQEQAQNAKAGLDVARAISKSDLKAADQRLTAVRAGLTALQQYLLSREKGN